MGDAETERRQLAAAGLEAPTDVSALSEDQKLIIVEQKRLAAERDDLVLPHVHEVFNAEPVSLSKEDLLRRAAAEEEEVQRLKRSHAIRLERDRKHREERWLSKVPPAFQDAEVDKLPTYLRSACRNWLALEERTNFIFIGPTGVGKTFTAYALGRALYIERSKVQIRDAAVLIDELKPGSSNREKIFNDVKNADYFILDDLGAERATEFAEERLHLILDHRWQWKLPTILTTNIAIDQFHKTIGKRLASRLLHNAEVALVKGEDRRTL